jgi:hypothetical protein
MEFVSCGQRQGWQKGGGEIARTALAGRVQIVARVGQVAALDFAEMTASATADDCECGGVCEQRSKPALTQSLPV